MNVKKIFGMLIALGAVLCITLALPVNAVAATASIPLAGSGFTIASGSTTPCNTPWVSYSSSGGIYVNIDTSAAGFTQTPLYFTSLGGGSSHWRTEGATSIYFASPTGFRVYVYYSPDPTAGTPTFANNNCWHINWMAIGQ